MSINKGVINFAHCRKMRKFAPNLEVYVHKNYSQMPINKGF